jgi:S-disulfanyl-L-cysteine oxidoreductase SoxD
MKKTFITAAWAAATLMALGSAASAQTYGGIGRAATPAEIKAWDIDVRPDFKGIPKGKGSVSRGETVWENACASCHGIFGESNEVFTPIVGGITKKDIEAGRVAALKPDANNPQRSTLQKVAHLSTLWDYINRAMPWNAPKSLSADEVYAVTAFILNMNNIVPADFVLSNDNIADVQQRMPNRNGITHAHAMWPDNDKAQYFKTMTHKPDVQGSACMKDCKVDGTITSELPDYARNAHGNLSEQMRPLGSARGSDTTKPPLAVGSKPVLMAAAPTPAPAPAAKSGEPTAASLAPILSKNTCTACHGVDNKIVGPSFKDIAKKYAGRSDGQTYLAGKIRAGGSGVWGNVPMPPQSLAPADADLVARWLMSGAPK